MRRKLLSPVLASTADFKCCVALVVLPGTIGHVAHGKSTVVRAISGVQTVRFRNEMKRNITIKLGYANAKVCRSPFLAETPVIHWGLGWRHWYCVCSRCGKYVQG